MPENSSEGTLREEIIANGTVVFRAFWDSGAPGPGAEDEYIYQYQGKYFPILSFDNDTGPYSSLEEALEASELFLVTEASVEFEAPGTSADQLAQMLHYRGDDRVSILVNRQPYSASPEGILPG